MKAKRILIVAGEASADLHASHLLSQLKRRNPDLHAFGVGGDKLCAEGFEAIVPASKLNVVGISDWWDRIGSVWNSYRSIVRCVQNSQVDLAVLLDLPDFNLSLVKHLKKKNIPVVYYISPQVWAWRKYRLRKIKKTVDEMLVVFPFEERFYKANGVNAHFVGHPMADSVQERKELRSLDEVLKKPRIALLPGSRESEIRFHLPLLKETVKRIQMRFPEAEFRLPVAPTLDLGSVREGWDSRVSVESVAAQSVLHWSDAALVASGTATLETALTGTPFCLFYRMAPFSYFVVSRLVSYEGHFGMPNIIRGKEIVREFIQDKADPIALAEEAERLLTNLSYRNTLRSELAECRKALVGPGVIGVADRVARYL